MALKINVLVISLLLRCGVIKVLTERETLALK